MNEGKKHILYWKNAVSHFLNLPCQSNHDNTGKGNNFVLYNIFRKSRGLTDVTGLVGSLMSSLLGKV